MGRLVIISGPSCVGKSPLFKALRKFHPDLAEPLKPVVLYNSRAPRPGEADGVDYHFRSRDEIEPLRERDGFSVKDVRGDLQALDHDELARQTGSADALFEGNPFVGKLLLDCPLPDGVERLGIFVSPLSRDEIIALREPGSNVALPEFVADVMRRKLLRRTRKQKGEPSLRDLEEVERRCGSAFDELAMGHHFEHVVPNHDGEDSENWTAFARPLGDARRAVEAVAELLAGRVPAVAESWDAELLGA
jgi:guanylate kinase